MTERADGVLLIRHPETEANIAGRLVGRGDSPVTGRGRLQVVALAARVAEWGPEAVFTSPLGRARSTAEAIAPAGVPLTVLAELAEIDFGAAEGLTFEEMRGRGMELDYAGGPVAPGGETGSAFDARVRGGAGVITAASSRAAVVTHGGVFRHLLSALTGMSVAEVWDVDVPNASVATLLPVGTSWCLKDMWVPDC